jgi:hypothetical protein
MHRYVAAAQSAYYKAITQLSKLQKERAANEEQEIGFVSYNDLPSVTTHDFQREEAEVSSSCPSNLNFGGGKLHSGKAA